jgi:TolA-binding protein
MSNLESRILERVQGILHLRPHDLAWRKGLLWAVAISIIGVTAGFILLNHQRDATIMYNKGFSLYTKGNYEKARKTFKEAMQEFPLSPVIDQTVFQHAVTYYKEEEWQEALEAFEQIAADYPETRRLGEVLYHIGMCMMRLHKQDEAASVLTRIIEEFPGEPWARYAKDRLKEMEPHG